jgi:SAM-dependent methyltransferase
MCNQTGIEFGARVLTAERVAGRDVIDVGALDVNGSLRPVVEPLGPARYLGVDIEKGPGVDEVVPAERLVSRYGREAFDVVITTEMVEHTRDWQTVVTNLKGVLRPGGLLLLTTRSPGFKYHAYPYDFWRYEPADLRTIFADLEILTIEEDSDAPGVFMLARRPEAFTERRPDVQLFSIITGRREAAVSDRRIRVYTTRSGPVLAPMAVAARPPGVLPGSARRLASDPDESALVPEARRLPSSLMVRALSLWQAA